MKGNYKHAKLSINFIYFLFDIVMIIRITQPFRFTNKVHPYSTNDYCVIFVDIK